MTLSKGNRLAKVNEDGSLVTGEQQHIFVVVALGDPAVGMIPTVLKIVE